MLYYNFKNYEEFKTLFGYQKHGNGTKSRKNKILLAYLKNPKLLKQARESGDYSLLHISDMAELKQIIMEQIKESSNSDNSLPYTIKLLNHTFKSSYYQTDEYNGLCEDKDAKAIRYINRESNRTFKMRAGKFFKNIIMESQFAQSLPPQVITFLTEEFVKEWEMFSLASLPNFRLCVDNNFEKIYDSECCDEDFESCTTDKNLHYFYSDSVNASAAYLLNEETNLVIARCVIYNEVLDEDDKTYRMAERQYSSSSVLKRLLVDSLVNEGYIDGYKVTDAGCGDSRLFVDVEGNSLSDKKFRISCNLNYNDCLSYQDSFKYYSLHDREAYNHYTTNYDFMLDTTDGEIEDENDQYDEYHDSYCYEVTTVSYQGNRITCDSDRLSDFVLLNGSYYHENDVSECHHCSNQFLTDNGYYSEQTERDYCCLDCKENDESANKTEEE